MEHLEKNVEYQNKDEHGDENQEQTHHASIPGWPRLSTWLKSLSTWSKEFEVLRDGFLVFVGVTYVLGYTVWAIYAWRNGLGLLPLLRFQYLVAGIPPLLSLTVGYMLIRGLSWIGESIVVRAGSGEKKVILGLWIILALLVPIGSMFLIPIVILRITLTPYRNRYLAFLLKTIAALGLLLISFTLIPRWAEWAVDHTPSWVQITIVASFVAVSYVLPYLISARGMNKTEPSKVVASPRERLIRRAKVAFNIYLMGVIPVLFFLYFVSSLYPLIPQELGGAHPRCAYLDIQVENLSQPSRELILPPGPVGPDTKSVRSKEVDILYAGNDVIMLRPTQRNWPGASVLELERSNITAIHSCKHSKGGASR